MAAEQDRDGTILRAFSLLVQEGRVLVGQFRKVSKRFLFQKTTSLTKRGVVFRNRIVVHYKFGHEVLKAIYGKNRLRQVATLDSLKKNSSGLACLDA